MAVARGSDGEIVLIGAGRLLSFVRETFETAGRHEERLAAPPAPIVGGGTAIVLAGTTTGDERDLAVCARLEGLGFQVALVKDDAARLEDAAAASLLVVAPSASAARVPGWLAKVGVPLVTLDRLAAAAD